MRSILIVEDELKIAQLARDYLERAGFTASIVGDGDRALQAARSETPDLMVLDLGLPHMDGLDVLRALRKDSYLPVIILTARGEESDRLIGLELGTDDYIVKPFSPKELVEAHGGSIRAESSPGEGARLIITLPVDPEGAG